MSPSHGERRLAEELDFEGINFVKVLEDFDEGVIIADVEGKILFYNHTQAKIDDLDREVAIGKNITDIYELNAERSIVFRCLTTGRPIINEPLVYRTCYGKTAYTLNSALPLFRDGKIVGAINFVKDYNLLRSALSSPSKALPLSVDRFDNGTNFTFEDIVGQDPAFIKAVKMAKMAADSPSSVMIMGMTGTGKELFAQAIHNRSHRRKNPYVAINCAAIPENLLEGILFGTAKGAFTGAVNKAGLFEKANGGTLFLDEINSMPIGLQAKLLRVLQEKKVRRVGSVREVPLDIKIISSLNTDPRQAIEQNCLRMDLYYRLAVIYIQIPMLRERGSDIELLTGHFIDILNLTLGKRVRRVSAEVMACFKDYDWPGNVRELQNTIEAALNMVGPTDDRIELEHLPGYLRGKNESTPRTKVIEVSKLSETTLSPPIARILSRKGEGSLLQQKSFAEKELIEQALSICDGNVTRSSKYLGISRQLLHYKLKKYGIDRRRFSK